MVEKLKILVIRYQMAAVSFGKQAVKQSSGGIRYLAGSALWQRIGLARVAAPQP